MQRTLFTVEHDAYRASVRKFVERHVVPHYACWEQAGVVDRSLFLAAGELGALGISAPTKHGGFGIDDFRYNAILSEEAARAAVSPATVGISLQADVCMPYLLFTASDAQRERWLPRVVRGETITALAITEPDAGSDLAGIRTRAIRDGDDYLLSGAKTFITNGTIADLVIVAARTGEHPHNGLSLFFVEGVMDGFSRSAPLLKVGMHVQDTAQLTFDNVRVPATHHLGGEGEGFVWLTRNLAQERLSAAISAVAAAASGLEWTIQYVRARHAFGKSIGAQQHIRFRLAELATEVDLTQTFIDRCILELNAGSLSPVDAAKAKWWATELQGRVLDSCVQFHGGNGYMLDFPIARAWIDSRASRIYGGTTEIMKEIIGRSLDLRGAPC
jgi:alkylation response protein AidB-like acyl-CoA dehydrogenase